jgi:hemolysin activation/secretion protein
MLKAGTLFLWQGSAKTQWASSVELVRGLDALGAGLTALDLVDDPRSADFFLAHLSLTRLTRFGERWSVRLDALAQQSPDVLPYDERFKIGGERLGRGYQVAEIAGDQGIGAKVEVRRELLQAPALLERVAVYGFYDIGETWQHDTGFRDSAATAGFGVAKQGRRLTGTLELAQPLTHPDVDGRKDLRLFAEILLSL